MAIKHKIKCFVFTSSIAVYGKNQLPMTEDTTPMPEDPYGVSKYAVELDLKCAHEMFGLNSIIFRPHNVYGERQNVGDKYRNVIGIFMNKIMMNERLTVFGDGKQTRAFSYIGDVAPIIARSVEVKEAYNQVFNVGADQPYSVNELVGVVAHEFGVLPQVDHQPARNEVQHAYSAHEKVKRVFHTGEPFSLKDGVHRMAVWAKENGAKRTEKFKNIEIEEKLPPIWRE
jgi:UDP-glucose 4-epimerase